MSLIQGMVAHYGVSGLRGLAAISAYRILGRPQILQATSPLAPHAIYLRLGTTDLSGFREILLREEYKFGLPSSARTIIDAGANIGLASIYYAVKFPQAQILSIEAEPSNFEALCRNVAPYPNIRPLHAALWGREGSVEVCDPKTGGFGKWGFVVREGHGVPAVTIPQLMRTHRFSEIDLLKCDIEGAEKEVFESCDWMDKVKALVIEMHDRFRPGCSAAVRAAAHNFRSSQRGELTLFLRA